MFTVQANGGPLPYAWNAPGSRAFTGSGTSANGTYATAGTYTVTVTDSRGQSATCTVTVLAAAPVTQVPTGPGEASILALIVSAIVTLLYIGYTATDVFQRRDIRALADKAKAEKDTFDFKR